MGKHNQQRLEQEMIDLGQKRYWKRVRRAKETNLESTTSVGQHLLANSVAELTDAIKRWIKDAKAAPGRRHRALEHMEMLPADVIAGLTARCVLDCISTERKIVSTANNIGRILEHEIRFRQLKEEHPSLWTQIQRSLDKYKSAETKSRFVNKTLKYHDLVMHSWDRKVSISVGLTCIELMRQSTGVIDVVTRKDPRGKSYTSVVPSDDLLKWLKDSHSYNEILNPVWLPMVERPVDWNNPWIGGYQSASMPRRPLVKTDDKAYLEELALSPMSEIYKSCNILQRTGFRINKFADSLLRHCWDRNLPVGGFPTSENDPVPNKPSDIATNMDARRDWRRSAAKVHFENERQKSKRITVAKALQQASKYKDETLYYTTSLDRRARGYYIQHPLQPHASQYVRSLLEFSSGKPITEGGLRWLYIDAANKWGLDKEPFEARIAFVEENMSLIRSVGADPTSNMVWADADNPFGFACVCNEINKLHENGSKHISHHPVGIDSTNQGLGIIGLVMYDEVIAAMANITDSDAPQDPYKNVADGTRKLLYLDASNPYSKTWLDFGIDRKTTKRPTMTLSYGSTLFSCREYTAEWFYDQLKTGRDNPFGDETYRPCYYLAGKIWESIGSVVGSALDLLSWLRAVAELCIEHGVIPRWGTPQLFPVKMEYLKQSKYAVKTLVNGRILNHRINVPTSEANRRKTVNSIVANFIHSLDGLGGILGRSLNLSYDRGVTDVFAIHDEVDVHASNVDVFGLSVREATAEIFMEDQLTLFANSINVLLPAGVEVPPMPARGSLDVTKVLNSKYYWN